MKYPTKCALCNSPNIFAADECEKELFFFCDRCNGEFSIEKTEFEQHQWYLSKQLGRKCHTCKLNVPFASTDGFPICRECDFNSRNPQMGSGKR